MTTQEVINMEKIYGKYYIKIHTDYGFSFPGNSGCRFRFWTNDIKYENDGSITFEPINTDLQDEWPLTINIHITNCAVFKMKETEEKI